MAAANEESELGEESNSLSLGERISATTLGLAAAGGGGVAVFVSDNQVGTGALLILAAALLLMGVQGTALSRFGMGENAVEFRTRRKIRAQLIEEAEAGEDPREVEAFARAAAIAAPTSASVAQSEALIYESQVGEALSRTGATSVRVSASSDHLLDYRSFYDGKQVDVVIKYTSPLRPPTPSWLLKTVEKVLFSLRPRQTESSLLVVVNVASDRALLEARERVAQMNFPVEIVRWASERDDDDLRAALARLAAR